MVWFAVAALVLAPLAALPAWLAWAHWRFAAYHRHKGVTLAPLGLGGIARAWLGEARAIVTLGTWYVRAALRNSVRPPEIAGRTVLCVHGWTQNPTNWWGLRRALEATGRPTEVVYLGPPWRRIETYAVRLEAALRDLASREPDGVDVVAHSMGGLVLRWVLANHPELAGAVRHVVTLGSPHQGTASSRGLLAGPEIDQMRRSSSFLLALPAFRDTAPEADVTTIAGDLDFVAYPEEACHLPGSRRVVLHGVGHAGLLTAPDAIRAVVGALIAAPATHTA